MNWNSITLYKYQQIEEVNKRPLPDIDKVLFSACVVFDMTEYELDNTPPAKVLKLTTRMQKVFEMPFSPKALTKVGRYMLNYDISKMTFGQYIELAFFLSQDVTRHAHYIMATISNKRGKRHSAKDHREKSEYFLQQPAEVVIGCVNLITDSFNRFNAEYKGLFGVDKNVSGDVSEEEFNKRHGWIYSATQVAEHEKITLDAAFALPVRQAFNDLAFLKAKGKYEAEQIRKTKKSTA